MGDPQGTAVVACGGGVVSGPQRGVGCGRWQLLGQSGKENGGDRFMEYAPFSPKGALNLGF